MGLISLLLQILGTTSDSIAVVDYFEKMLAGQGDTVEGRFIKCFNRAVNRQRNRLGHFVRDKSADLVAVDVTRLKDAVHRTNSDPTFLAAVIGTHDAIKALTPAFRDVLILPGHQLRTTEFDSEVNHILTDAFAWFFESLPTSPAAAHQIEIGLLRQSVTEQAAHRSETNRDHADQAAAIRHLQKTLEQLERQRQAFIDRSPSINPLVLQQESTRPERKNPFRIVKAEDFNHDYDRIASLFREPAIYDSLRGPDNLIIAGGRGCGKSMILRSLSAPTAVQLRRLKGLPSTAKHWPETGLDYFGVYIKLARGYFHEWSPDCKLTQEAATQLFQHVFNMILLRATTEALLEAQHLELLRISGTTEAALVRKICLFAGFTVASNTFDSLLERILIEDTEVRTYIGSLRLSASSAEYKGAHTDIHNFLADCCATICTDIPDLQGCRIFFLLDEYENLAEFQQCVVNTLAKLRPTSLSLKVATRALGIKSVVDLQGEPIQRPRDYDIKELDYDIKDAPYRQLLLDIAAKRLEAEGFRDTDINHLLPTAPKYHPSTITSIEQELVLKQANPPSA